MKTTGRRAAWALSSLAKLLSGCDLDTQEIRVAAQDFRFVPSEIHLQPNRPARIVILNEGRERHEFSSSLLAHATVRTASPPSAQPTPGTDLLPILPGQSIQVKFMPTPGVYEIRCVVKGHAGMRGMIIVEEG